ncbi:hypothetical protein ACFL5Y_02195 [Candidatus Omnitrophota bacterium]
MKKWLTVLGIVFLVEVIAEAAHLMSGYIFIREVSRVSIVAFVALFLSVSILIHRRT